jgi:hypothetical protein
MIIFTANLLIVPGFQSNNSVSDDLSNVDLCRLSPALAARKGVKAV